VGWGWPRGRGYPLEAALGWLGQQAGWHPHLPLLHKHSHGYDMISNFSVFAIILQVITQGRQKLLMTIILLKNGYIDWN